MRLLTSCELPEFGMVLSAGVFLLGPSSIGPGMAAGAAGCFDCCYCCKNPVGSRGVCLSACVGCALVLVKEGEFWRSLACSRPIAQERLACYNHGVPFMRTRSPSMEGLTGAQFAHRLRVLADSLPDRWRPDPPVHTVLIHRLCSTRHRQHCRLPNHKTRIRL